MPTIEKTKVTATVTQLIMLSECLGYRIHYLVYSSLHLDAGGERLITSAVYSFLIFMD